MNILKEIQEKKNKQKDIAKMYANKLHQEIDWEVINRTIIKRWSISGLQRIKTMAWKIFEDTKVITLELINDICRTIEDAQILNMDIL